MPDTPFHRIAELLDEQYPDPAPPKEWRDGFYLSDVLTEEDFERVRKAITVEVEAPE